MNCSVIIVNYNTGALLRKVVDSVLEQSAAIEVIVIDNNSHDSSMAALNNDERIKKYYQPQNIGFASGCNLGASYALSENLVFLNPDCLLPNNSINQLLANLEPTNVGMVGCRVNNPDGSEQKASRRRLPTFWRATKSFSGMEKLASICHCFTGVNLNHQPISAIALSVEAISGACMLMKKDFFEVLGKFDEKYPMHFEDLDLMKRVLNANHKIIFDPRVIATHHQGTSSQHNPKVAEMKRQGLIRYFEKHQSKMATMMIKVIAKVF